MPSLRKCIYLIFNLRLINIFVITYTNAIKFLNENKIIVIIYDSFSLF